VKTKEKDEAIRDVARELAALATMNVRDLRAKHLEVFRAPSDSRNKNHLQRKIAYRIQEQAFGGLSARARARLEDLAPSLPTLAPPMASAEPATRDGRLPPPGTILRRDYRGQPITVEVLRDGFAYAGKQYRSLSAVARAVTGTSWNGLAFFGLNKVTSEERSE
jgi:hypothetical protein